MKRYLCLLRGINVSGKNMIRMPDLVGSLIRSGFSEVQSYIQSGNILFCHDEESTAELSREIERLIIRDFGFNVPAQVLTPEELWAVVNDNPFINKGSADIEKLHITFLSGNPDERLVEKLLSFSFPPDEILISGKAAYLHCPEGYGRTKYNNTFIEKKLGVQATTRNWRTCLTLFEMLSK